MIGRSYPHVELCGTEEPPPAKQPRLEIGVWKPPAGMKFVQLKVRRLLLTVVQAEAGKPHQ